YKHLTDYVDPNQSYIYDFAVLAQGLTGVGTTLGLVTAPANAGRGYIRGAELTLSMPFGNFSRALDGFGFFGSASYTDSSIKLGSNPNNPITL
ncbi:hypothetical protein ABTM26_19390, partial [Acinetobacter baumannii]